MHRHCHMLVGLLVLTGVAASPRDLRANRSWSLPRSVSDLATRLDGARGSELLAHGRAAVDALLSDGSWPDLGSLHPSLRAHDPGDLALGLLFARGKKITVLGRGPSPGEALENALHELGSRYGSALSRRCPEGYRLQIDLLGAGICLPNPPSPEGLASAIRPGLDGIRASAGERSAIVLPHEILLKGLVQGSRLDGEATWALLRRRGRMGEPERVERVPVTSFVETPRGVRRLVRANLPPSPLAEETLHRALLEAGNWLLRHQKDDGLFWYVYDPLQDSYDEGNNIVRHAGTAYGLLALYRATGRQAYLDTAMRALEFLSRTRKRWRGSCFVDWGGFGDLGGAALTLLALCELPDGQRSESVMQFARGLGRFIVALQDPEGHFHRDPASADSGCPAAPIRFYPGEALLALCRLSLRDEDPRWLLAARKAADRQCRDFDAGESPCHWQIQGLSLLYRITRKARYLRGCLAQADHFLRLQFQTPSPDLPERSGAFDTLEIPASTDAAAITEGLGAAELAASAADMDPRPYRRAILRACRFIASQQYLPENCFFLPRPDRARGGFRRNLLTLSTRIDFNQHAIVALLHGARLQPKSMD